MEQENDKFAVEIHVHKKSVFMMLSFEDRIIKLRDYYKKEEYPFLGMLKKKNKISED